MDPVSAALPQNLWRIFVTTLPCPATEGEHQGHDEEDETNRKIQDCVDKEDVRTESWPSRLWKLEDTAEAEETRDDTEDKGENEEELNDEKPGRHQPFSDLSVGAPPHAVTSIEQNIEL